MKTRRRVFAALLLILCMLVSVITPHGDVFAEEDYSDATTEAYEAELQRLANEQTELEGRISAIRGDKENAAQYSEFLSKQITLTRDKVQLTQTLLAAIAGRIAVKENEIAGDGERIEEVYRGFLSRISYAHENGTASYLEMLLDSRSLTDLLSRAEQVASLLDYDLRLKRKYEDSKRNLESAKAELEESYASQILYGAELEKDIEKLEASVRENEAYLDSLAMSEADARQRYEERVAEQQKLEAELEDYIQEQIRKSQQETYVGGKFLWPLDGMWRYVTEDFGWRTYEIYGITTSDFHNGIDISATGGSEIHAANAGQVLIATYNASYGYYLLIDHGGSYSTLYAHASRLCVTAGDYVTAGQLVALVGSTGYSTGNHLHFEIRVNGERVDPLAGNLLSFPTDMVVLS